MTDLITRLRETASKSISVWGDLQMEAAKEIEILAAEREAYASAMDRMKAKLAEIESQEPVGYVYAPDADFNKRAIHLIEGDEEVPVFAAAGAQPKVNQALLEALKEAVACGMVPASSVKDGGASKHSRQVVVADMIRAAIAAAAEGTTT